MGWLKTLIFKKILSQWIPFSWIDGHKKEIGRILTAVSSVLLALSVFKPEWVPFISQGQALLATIASMLGIELAKAHDEAKEAGGFGER